MNIFDIFYPLPASGVITILGFLLLGAAIYIYRLVLGKLSINNNAENSNAGGTTGNNTAESIRYFIVDVFTDDLFKGNPAGVCILDNWMQNNLLQDIAAENNLPETAFVVKKSNQYELRWFTPKTEVDLCGHATLAGAFILANFINKESNAFSFNTKSGILNVHVNRLTKLYEMDFPSRKPMETEINTIVQKAVSAKIQKAYISRDLLLLVDTEEQVQNLEVDFDLLMTIKDCFGFIVTAPSSGAEYDFVSRFFAPNAGIPEDPVTGSSHSTLIPFWAEKLNKNKLIARQLSKRGGILYCENNGERVKISGKARLYMEGEIKLRPND